MSPNRGSRHRSSCRSSGRLLSSRLGGGLSCCLFGSCLLGGSSRLLGSGSRLLGSCLLGGGLFFGALLFASFEKS